VTKARLFPHQRAAGEAVDWGGWVVARDGGDPEPVEERLTGWDYSTATSFATTVDVDMDALLESTRLDVLDDVDLVVMVDCPATGHRDHTATPLPTVLEKRAPVRVEVKPGLLADRVRLTAHLVLNVLQPMDGLRAFRPASRLLESPTTTVVLEGELHRFPTEAVSFSALRLEPAAWTLRTNFTDLDDSFVGSVRLLINTDHPASGDLIAMTGRQTAPLRAFLRLDVARQLLTAVAADHGLNFDSGDIGVGASLRSGLEAMTRSFLSMDLSDTVEIARADPARFERLLQVGFEFLQDHRR
jgi:hypothetical protein